MKFIIYPKQERIQANIFCKKEFFSLQKDTSALEITVKVKGNLWVSYLIYDGNGEIRGEYIGPNTQRPLIISEVQTYSPNTITGEFPTSEWLLEVCCAVFQEEIHEDSYIQLEIIEKTAAEMMATPSEIKNERYWYKKDTGVFHLTESMDDVEFEDVSKWYKGDFHTHTIYSDGKMTREDNLAQAQKMGLDFFVATDHNIVPTSWPKSNEVLVIPGIEVTSPHGHYNQIGVSGSPFEKEGFSILQDSDKLAASFEKTGRQHINSINHPFLGDWKWLAGATKLAEVDTIEIWNDPTYKENILATEKALQAWDILLADGYTITGIGGSDSHLLPTELYPESTLPSLIGDPATYVFSESSHVPSILDHVKQGNVWVSRFNLDIDFQVNQAIVGSRCPYTEKINATLLLRNVDLDCLVEWIIDGKIVMQEMTQVSNQEFSLEQADYHYIRVNVRSSSGELLGFTNPVYFGKKKPCLQYWKDLVDVL